MRFCIIGGGGYVGQMLAQSLLQTSANESDEAQNFVVLLDVNFTNFPHIQLNEQLTLRIKGSIFCDIAQLRTALQGCDACFHLAGYGMSGGPSLERQKCFDINVLGTKNVIEECKSLGVTRLLFTSSVSVIFDGQHELHMADEEDTPYAKQYGNPYAESKSVAEQMLLAANCPPQLATCAFRLRGIYGPGELRTVQRCVNLCRYGIVKCTFSKSQNPLTQYSSAENIVNALMLAEKSLRNPESLAAGKAYHIVDGGPPVHPWAFWFPLIAALGCTLPTIRVPYSIILTLAFLFEWLYKIFGIEPLFTRYEVSLLAITNTFSIRRAQQDFGYSPVRSHCLEATIQFCHRQKQLMKQTNSKIAKKQKKVVSTVTKWWSCQRQQQWTLMLSTAGCLLYDCLFSVKGLLGLSKCAAAFLLLFLLLFFASSMFMPM